MNDQPNRRSRWWNGCFVVLAAGWGLLLIAGFATTFKGPTWDRFGPPGYDMGPVIAFFVGLGLLYGVKWAGEAIWDFLGRHAGGDTPIDPPGPQH